MNSEFKNQLLFQAEKKSFAHNNTINNIENRNKENIEHLMKPMLKVVKRFFQNKNQMPKNQTQPNSLFKIQQTQFLLVIFVDCTKAFKSLFSIIVFAVIVLICKIFFDKKRRGNGGFKART